MSQVAATAGFLTPRYINTQQSDQTVIPKGACLADVSWSFMPELAPSRRRSMGRLLLSRLELWSLIYQKEHAKKQYYIETQSLLELLVSMLDAQFDNDTTQELYQVALKRIKQWQDKYSMKRNQHKCLSEHDKVSQKLDVLYDYFCQSETAQIGIANGRNRALVNLSYAIEDNRRGALKDLCACPSNTLFC
eukprot:TRINITY_DN10371_c0_g1_i1.p2 TRINITY_DN10371_c0_g1~~TRINITY_DN10371_c0_g1_i1.p2  ORF type:complete len:191 (+),score=29.83 TRINITY_DN10371_c0_g1_i1:171-743(+)